MQIIFTGKPDDNVTRAIDIPTTAELGRPDITAQDTYAGADIAVDDSAVPLLIGPPHRIATSIVPAEHVGWPNQTTDMYPVTFQVDINNVTATVTDRRGEPVMAGMPIYFTQTWRNFDEDRVPYDYLGCFGHASITGDVQGGPVGRTNSSGVASAGFQSNHSGMYTIRAFALDTDHAVGMSILDDYNTNLTGGLMSVLPSDSDLLPYLLWSDTNPDVTQSTPTTVITNSSTVINKTLVASQESNGEVHWTILSVSKGIEIAVPADYSSEPTVKPKVLVDMGGDTACRVRFTATDTDWKKVLPGVPFRAATTVTNYGPLGGLIAFPTTNPYANPRYGLLQLTGINPLEDVTGQILGFTDNSEAVLLSRGNPAAPITGPVKLVFDSMRTTSPVTAYPSFTHGFDGPSVNEPMIIEEPPDNMVVRMFTPDGFENFGGPIRLADLNGRGAGMNKSINIEVTLKDINGNPYPNYTVEIWGYGMLRPIYLKTSADGLANYTYNAADLDRFASNADIVDTGLSSFNPPNPIRNLRINIYGAPWDPPRSDWYNQYVTVERPHFMELIGAPTAVVLPLNAEYNMVGTADNNMLVDPMDPFSGPMPVLSGFTLSFGVIKPPADGSTSAFTPAAGDSEFGALATKYNTGPTPGFATIFSYYDKNGNSVLDGDEPVSTMYSYQLGLVTPGAPGVTYNAVTNLVTITWAPVQGATSYRVEWNTTGNDPWAELTTTTGTSTTHTPPGTGITLYYRVIATVGGVESAPSPTGNVAIPAP